LAGANVHVTGGVPSVAPYLARGTLFVAPLRQGGGTRMKLIEALAAGIPVVTTSLGAQGLGAVPGRHLLIADDPAAFAETVVKALADRKLRDRLGRSGQALVQEQTQTADRAAHLSAILAEAALAPTLL
jgi:glycosyltransferase involved in cell wall biosynthesis